MVLTGASGSGKTTLARHIQGHYPDLCKVLFFDSIGVPPADVMTREYGSGSEWQRAMTLRWMEWIAALLFLYKPVLFEGQMRISFIEEALANCAIATARIILVDCDDAIRATRLIAEREQVELANPTTMNWARFLREEALASKSEILDTGVLSFMECVLFLVEQISAA